MSSRKETWRKALLVKRAGVSFLSTMNPGTLTVAVDSSGNPENGYGIELELIDMGSSEVSAMDGHNSPLGSRFTDEDGKMVITLAAGETLSLYNMQGGAFVLRPQAVPGYHVSEILLDGAEADGHQRERASCLPMWSTGMWRMNIRNRR